MPRFFFDLATSGHLEADESGVEFKHLEAAYLDTCRAVLEISMEMLQQRRDPTRHRFLIRDAQGRCLIDVPFREVLQPGQTGGPPVVRGVSAEALACTLARSRQLKTELRAGFKDAQASVKAAQAILRRAR